MTLGENVKRIRLEKGMTQEKLSDDSNVGRITISRLESGELQNPTIGTVKKLAEGLGVAESELLSG